MAFYPLRKYETDKDYPNKQAWIAARLLTLRHDLNETIEKVIDAMDPIDREVLILRHFEQLTNDEVASILGIKKAAASRRYMRALKRFREAIDTIPGFDSDTRLLRQ